MGRGQRHVSNFYIVDLENFAAASCRYTGDIHKAGISPLLCDPIWHVSSRSGEASCELLYSVYLLPF